MPKVIHPKYVLKTHGQVTYGLVSGRLVCTSRNLKQYSSLNSNLEFSIKFRMYVF